MRLPKFVVLIFLVAQAGVSFAGLAIDLDYACFSGRDSLAYVEVYASVQRSQLVHTEVDSGFVSRFRLILDIDLDGKPLVTDTLHGVDAVANEEELKAGQFFPHVFAFYMRPGRYDARATLMDEMGKIVERKRLVLDVRLIPKDRLTISDIELACTVQRTDEVSRFWKNGLHVLPNPIRFFGTQLPLFYYYCELYNLKFSEDFPDSFSVHRQIRSAETGTIVRKFPSHVKEKVGTSAVEADGFPITTLRTGTYVLEIRVTDLYDNSVASQAKKFWIYRPEDFEPGREVVMDTNFVDRLTEFALPAMEMDEAATALEQMRYILTPEENAQVRRLTPEGKVRFLKEYWVRVGRERGIDPEIARWEHIQRVEEANRRFSYLKKDGWKTDRGRVFVQLGSPDLVDHHVAAQEVPDYEIWYYDKVEGGVQYIFADRSGFGNLELVHSTKRGEISDPNWMQKLAGRPISDPTHLSP
jgi:GWxTD domain-containing protein